MTKVRKVKRKKSYQYNVNRKRMNKTRLPTIESTPVLKAWNPRTSSQKNFKNLGLAFDVNKDIKSLNRGGDSQSVETTIPTNTSVINQLEEEAKCAAPGKRFRLSQDNVEYLTYLVKKYGDDYKAMSRDKKNYLQCTWKQLRHKINKLKSNPYYCNESLKNKKS